MRLLGLEYLQRAVPPLNKRDSKSNGDLFYNFAIGYTLLQTESEAVKYYELALEEYQSEKDNYIMEAVVAKQIGQMCANLPGRQLEAARAYSVAAVAHGILQVSNQFYQESSLLWFVICSWKIS